MAKLTTLEGLDVSKPVVKYSLIAAVGIGALLIVKHNTKALGDKALCGTRSRRKRGCR